MWRKQVKEQFQQQSEEQVKEQVKECHRVATESGWKDVCQRWHDDKVDAKYQEIRTPIAKEDPAFDRRRRPQCGKSE